MTKSEFLEILTESLTGEIPGYELESNIRYYDEYITDACESGQSIEDVLELLGDPRLIARTIIDTSQFPSKGPRNYSEEENYEQAQSGQTSYHKWQMHYDSSEKVPWHKKILNIALLVLILLLVFMLISVFFNIFFSIGIPIILFLLMVNLILRLFR